MWERLALIPSRDGLRAHLPNIGYIRRRHGSLVFDRLQAARDGVAVHERPPLLTLNLTRLSPALLGRYASRDGEQTMLPGAAESMGRARFACRSAVCSA